MILVSAACQTPSQQLSGHVTGTVMEVELQLSIELNVQSLVEDAVNMMPFYNLCSFFTQADQGQLCRVLHRLLDLPGLLQPGGAAALPPAAADLRQLRAGQAGVGEAATGRPVQGEAREGGQGAEGQGSNHLQEAVREESRWNVEVAQH